MGPTRDAGFTLVELMVVSVIMGTLTAMAMPRLNDAILKAQIARAIGDIRIMELELYDYWSDGGTLPATLADIGRGAFRDPWGNPYAYAPIAGNTTSSKGGKDGKGGSGKGDDGSKFRKDRFLKPLNSDFDLYSLGADGRSNAALSAGPSQDDVVRANDGAFLGLASEY